MSERWYYAEGDGAVGPVGVDELLTTLKRRIDAPRVLVWQQGFQDWVEVSSVPELSRMIVRPPPLPDRQQAIPAFAPTSRPVSPLSSENKQAPTEAGNKQRSWSLTIVGWVSAAISLTLSRVLGAVFWMPLLLTAVSVWALTKLKLRGYTTIMLGVLVGHTLWMTIGHLTILGQNKQDPDLLSFSFDFALVLVLTIWGIKMQSVAMGACVLIYQLFALGTNLMLFDDISKVDAAAPYIHIALRLLGVGVAINAIVMATRFKREGPPDEALTA
jgi:hypothetical protein